MYSILFAERRQETRAIRQDVREIKGLKCDIFSHGISFLWIFNISKADYQWNKFNESLQM